MEILRSEFQQFDTKKQGRTDKDSFKRVLSKFGVDVGGMNTILGKFYSPKEKSVDYEQFLKYFEIARK